MPLGFCVQGEIFLEDLIDLEASGKGKVSSLYLRFLLPGNEASRLIVVPIELSTCFIDSISLSQAFTNERKLSQASLIFFD